MILITSGAYAESSLSSEFGKIPAAFVPVGNRRLFERQVESLKNLNEAAFISLPENFEVPEFDLRLFDQLGLKLIRVPDELSLGQSILYSLEHMHAKDDVKVLYGDTLFPTLPKTEADTLLVGTPRDNYGWYYYTDDNTNRPLVMAGFFHFSSATRLAESVRECGGDWLKAVEHYSALGIKKEVAEEWLDLGHIHTYFRSKTQLTTQRHFNGLKIRGGVVNKSSSNHKKLQAESEWYQALPPNLKIFSPQLISSFDAKAESYSVEYLNMESLSELFVFGDLPAFVWDRILLSCIEFLDKSSSYFVSPISEEELKGTYYLKTLKRLEEYQNQSGIRLDQEFRLNGKASPSLKNMIEDCYERIRNSALSFRCFSHGDFCFSNILMDFRSQRIKLVDPRGLNWKDEFSQVGDFRYDLGKLAHSVWGLYDSIISGRYRVNLEQNNFDFEVFEPQKGIVGKSLSNMKIKDRRFADWDLIPVSVLLFLSMIPLHKDDPKRQQAFLANALRMYLEVQR